MNAQGQKNEPWWGKKVPEITKEVLHDAIEFAVKCLLKEKKLHHKKKKA